MSNRKIHLNNGRLRVCHVCSGHPADDGRVFHRACVALVEDGYEVHLIAQSSETQVYERKNVIIHPLSPAGNRYQRWRDSGRIARIAASLDADLFHVHEPALLGPVIKYARGRPVIWDAHESYLDVLADRHWLPPWLRRVARTAWDRRERQLLRKCCAVVAATEHVASRYHSLHDEVVVVRNCPDLTTVDERKQPGGETRCVFAGTLLPNRGISQAIEALALLKREGLSIPLELAGIPESPEYVQSLLKQAKSLGIGDLVTYHGVLPRAEAIQLQRNAAIGLVLHLPSSGNNLAALPVKMLECMALGLPVVYSNIPSHIEIAGQNSIGIGVDPDQHAKVANAIRKLAENPDLAQSMGESARQAVANRFSWSSERGKLLELYRKILGESKANIDSTCTDPTETAVRLQAI